MSETNKAVFLSYAREDSDAARRIAEALRVAGIEAWFDQSELRGGDVWDAKIRKQIHECALFVPIVSAHTQARAEGYFRREWRLAVERTRDMSSNVSFIVPVAIDDLRQADADVPEEFLRYQWATLREGEAVPKFVEQVRRLLEGQRRSVSPRGEDGGRRTEPAPQEIGDKRQGTSEPSARLRTEERGRRKEKGSNGLSKWAVPAVIGLLIGFGGFFALRPAKVAPSAAAPAPSSLLPTPGDATPSAKSIAVLPFANLSDDKDASAFFSDGIHEDILTNLSNIRELRVVSRTSVLGYRATTKKMAAIAQELGVAYILEGSVRRAGNKVRVTGQLIRAATDEHVWARNFDRELTDVFAIQSELAQAIAGELKAAISPEEKKRLEQKPTQSIAAYELVLKARQLRDQALVVDNQLEARERLLQTAIQLDPNYALAHVELGFLYLADGQYFGGRKELTKATAAIDRAAQLAPDLPELIRVRGDFLYYGQRQYAPALEQYERFTRIRPNDPAALNRIGSIQRRQHLYREALKTWRTLEQVDPANSRNVRDIAVLLTAGRRFDEAIVQARRVINLNPGIPNNRYELARLAFLATGSTREGEQFFRDLSPEIQASPEVRDLRVHWALLRGEVREVLELTAGSNWIAVPDGGRANQEVLTIAAVHAAQGDREFLHRQLKTFVAEYRAQMADPSRPNEVETYGWADIGFAEALLGNKEEAVRLARLALSEVPEARDSLIGANLRASLAIVLAWVGDKDGALAELAHVLRTPYGYPTRGAGSYSDLTVHTLRVDPRFAPLRGDSRFEVLLREPKNHEPLF